MNQEFAPGKARELDRPEPEPQGIERNILVPKAGSVEAWFSTWTKKKDSCPPGRAFTRRSTMRAGVGHTFLVLQLQANQRTTTVRFQ